MSKTIKFDLDRCPTCKYEVTVITSHTRSQQCCYVCQIVLVGLRPQCSGGVRGRATKLRPKIPPRLGQLRRAKRGERLSDSLRNAPAHRSTVSSESSQTGKDWHVSCRERTEREAKSFSPYCQEYQRLRQNLRARRLVGTDASQRLKQGT